MKEICKNYSGLKSKNNINNVVYSPNACGVKTEENITFNNGPASENIGIDITYDRDSDDFVLTFNESTN